MSCHVLCVICYEFALVLNVTPNCLHKHVFTNYSKCLLSPSRVFCWCKFQSHTDEVSGLDQDRSGIPNAISSAVPLTQMSHRGHHPNDVWCPQSTKPDGTCFKCR